MHWSNFIFLSRLLSSCFHAIYWQVYFFLYSFEMIPLSYTKFLDVFESFSVLPMIFHWSIHRPMPQCWNCWSYINVLISGKSSPFTLLLKSFPSYPYFSIWTLESTCLGKKKKIPKPLGILIKIMLNLFNLEKGKYLWCREYPYPRTSQILSIRSSIVLCSWRIFII